MKKIFAILMCLISMFSLVACAPDTSSNTFPEVSWIGEENADFLNSNWGDTLEQVKEENNSLYFAEEPGIIGALANVDGYKSNVLFEFDEENKLFKCFAGSYFTVDDERLNEFYMIKDKLTELYGAPTRDEEIWYNNENENNPDKLIESILLKHVIFNVVWEIDDTNIVLYLDSEGSFVAFEKA